jgi:hypothetical protein
MNHPCLTCSLPDCDDKSRKCALRRALATYERCRAHLTPEIREARRVAYAELRGGGREGRVW